MQFRQLVVGSILTSSTVLLWGYLAKPGCTQSSEMSLSASAQATSVDIVELKRQNLSKQSKDLYPIEEFDPQKRSTELRPKRDLAWDASGDQDTMGLLDGFKLMTFDVREVDEFEEAQSQSPALMDKDLIAELMLLRNTQLPYAVQKHPNLLASSIFTDIGLLSSEDLNAQMKLDGPALFGDEVAAEPPPATPEASPDASKNEAPQSGSPNATSTDNKQKPPPYVLPVRPPGSHPSRASRCDSMEHLKIPRSYRRLDTYPRPEAFMPAAPANDFWHRDQFTGNWGGLRDRLYDMGIDFYGCWVIDYARDIISNADKNNPAVVPPGRPVHRDQWNLNQLYGGDIYSRFFSKNWKGAQFHWSVSWPESDPLYTYRNRLNPSGTGQLHGHFFTDQGIGDPTSKDQGIRLFELWFQQRYGKDLRNFVRFGNIYPMINISKSGLSGIFNFWTFTEPCMFGTNYFVGNAPCYPQAPLGFQIYQVLNDHLDFAFQINQGYYASTGRNNIRGITWDLSAENGVEGIGEFTYRGGTYSLDPKEQGKPWFFRWGGQFHTGLVYNNHLDINGDNAALTGLPRRRESGRGQVYLSFEAMVHREKGSYSQGLTIFAKAGSSFREDVNSVKRWATVGMGYEGLFNGRDRDVLYAGWGRLMVTDGVQIFQRADKPCRLTPNCVINGTQDVFEVGYSMEIAPWMFIDPMFQYIRNPNTRHDLGDIFTFGITTRIGF